MDFRGDLVAVMSVAGSPSRTYEICGRETSNPPSYRAAGEQRWAKVDGLPPSSPGFEQRFPLTLSRVGHVDTNHLTCPGLESAPGNPPVLALKHQHLALQYFSNSCLK